jgi:hypothetical protein
MESNVEDDVLVANHVTIEDRFAAARASVERLGLTLPVLVDRMSDDVSNAFAAWPERVYVVGGDGLLVYVGGPGPFEFEPDAAAAVLDELL